MRVKTAIHFHFEKQTEPEPADVGVMMMKKVITISGFALTGEDKFYKTEQEAQIVTVQDERLRLIKNGVGGKWCSDPIGEFLRNEELVQAVAAVKYSEDEDKTNA
jgi:hypothetical protein